MSRRSGFSTPSPNRSAKTRVHADPGRALALIESHGIKHGDHFVATFEVRDVTRQYKRRNEMWMVDARPLERD